MARYRVTFIFTFIQERCNLWTMKSVDFGPSLYRVAITNPSPSLTATHTLTHPHQIYLLREPPLLLTYAVMDLADEFIAGKFEWDRRVEREIN